MPHILQLASVVESPATAQFVVLLVIGVAVSLALAAPCALDCRLTNMILVGACGAWLGAELIALLAAGNPGAPAQLAAGALGAGLSAYMWRVFHPAEAPGRLRRTASVDK